MKTSGFCSDRATPTAPRQGFRLVSGAGRPPCSLRQCREHRPDAGHRRPGTRASELRTRPFQLLLGNLQSPLGRNPEVTSSGPSWPWLSGRSSRTPSASCLRGDGAGQSPGSALTSLLLPVLHAPRAALSMRSAPRGPPQPPRPSLAPGPAASESRMGNGRAQVPDERCVADAGLGEEREGPRRPWWRSGGQWCHLRGGSCPSVLQAPPGCTVTAARVQGLPGWGCHPLGKRHRGLLKMLLRGFRSARGWVGVQAGDSLSWRGDCSHECPVWKR